MVADWGISVREHQPDDVSAIRSLWDAEAEAGRLSLATADGEEAVKAFLEENEGLSYGLWQGGELVASVIAGSDGRTGRIYRVVIAGGEDKSGQAMSLVNRSLEALSVSGAGEVQVLVSAENEEERAAWEKLGFEHRSDLSVLSRDLGGWALLRARRGSGWGGSSAPS